MAVTETELTYEVDGVEMCSRFYSDDALTGDLPGVLVYPDARGLDDVCRDGARRLAQEGYRALACDLYGGGEYFTNTEEAIAKATRRAAVFGSSTRAPTARSRSHDAEHDSR